jgi:capsular polysaccharide transport system permease protein
MSVEPLSPPVRVPPSERAERLSASLSETARRLRFTTSRRTLIPASYRARRSQQLARFLKALSFVLLVAVPTLASVAYFGFVAADQYVAEARFAVRSGAMAGIDPLSTMTGLPSVQVIQDTQIVTNYIGSRALVEHLSARARMLERYSAPEADFHARLDPHEPIERIVRYWRSMVHTGIEMPGGIVVLSVRAFRPDDAVGLANAVVEASERLVNDMNDRARQDALTNADHELQLAARRLAQARAALEVARNREGMLDAPSEAKKTDELIAAVRKQQLEMEQQYAVSRKSVAEDAPQMRNLRLRIDAAAKQVEQLKSELTAQDSSADPTAVLSSSMTRLSALELERQVAESQYTASAAALERARVASQIKEVYLTSFVQPVAPEEPRYPRRFLNIALTVLGGLLAWAVAMGVAKLVRYLRG